MVPQEFHHSYPEIRPLHTSKYPSYLPGGPTSYSKVIWEPNYPSIALFWNTLQKLQIEKHIKKAALNKCDQCNYPRIDPSRLMQDKKSPLNDNTENADNSDETLVFYNSWIIREAIGLKNICTSGHWSGAYYASHVFPFVWGGCFLPYCWRNAVQFRL